MKNITIRLSILVAMLFALAGFGPAAFAWDCPTGQIRQQAPPGTPTNTPNYDVVEGIAFICVPANPAPTGSQTTNTNTNTNTNQNVNSNTNNNTSKSSSTSSGTGVGVGIGVGGSSTSTATGGSSNSGSGGVNTSGITEGSINTGTQNSNTAVGGAGGQGGQGGQGGKGGSSVSTSIAEGGAGGSVKDSGNSSATGGSVKDSGNSALVGSGNSHQSQGQQQGQGQTQSSTSSASNNGNGNGNGANNSSYSSTYIAPKQTASAIAPPAFPSAPCFKTYAGAGQAANFGFSIGGGKVDPGCDARELARSFVAVGNLTAAAKVLCSTKAAQRAHLTMEDCLAVQAPAVPVVEAPVPAPEVAPITVNVPAPTVTVIEQPAPTPSVTTAVDVVAAAKKVKQRHAVKSPCVTDQTTKPSGS